MFAKQIINIELQPIAATTKQFTSPPVAAHPFAIHPRAPHPPVTNQFAPKILQSNNMAEIFIEGPRHISNQ